MMAEQLVSIAVTLLLLLCCFVPRDETQCNFIGAVIGAAASLIGGSKDRKAQREANEANRPVNQVREWEEAGINPLFGISSGGYVPHQAASIGDSYATAGARFGQAIDAVRAEKLEQTELKQENRELREKLDDLATPRVPSYMSQYGAIIPLPRLGDFNAQGNQNPSRRSGVVSPVSRSSGDTSGLGETSSVAPGREIEVAPYSTGSGLTEINNAGTSGGIVVPGSDGEPWGIDEVATALVFGGPQWVWNTISDPAVWDEGTLFNPKKSKTKPRPPKTNTKTKAYRDFMKDAYPTAFD